MTNEVEEVIADHLVLLFWIRPDVRAPVEACCLARATTWARPENCPKDHWRESVAREWALLPHMDIPGVVDQAVVDRLWDEHVFRVCKTAWVREHGDASQRDLPDGRSVLPKNGVKLYRTPVCKGTRLQPGVTFRERKLQKLAHRLSEMLRLRN